jgi:peptidoglycan/LPS O-acetylase OafA/YrhL
LRPLVFAGTISYSLYLVHQKIGHAVLIELASRGWSPLARIAAATLLALALASAITFLVERPALQEIRRRYKARAVGKDPRPRLVRRRCCALASIRRP